MKFLYRWLIATLAGAPPQYSCGEASHTWCCSKTLALTACPTRNESFQRFAPPCLKMVCISSRVSISEETQPKKQRPPGKRDFGRALQEWSSTMQQVTRRYRRRNSQCNS